VLGDGHVEYGDKRIRINGREVDLDLASPYDDMLPDEA